MNPFKKTVKPTSVIMVTILLLFSVSYQFASAAMIGTQELLQTRDPQDQRDYFHHMMARDEIKKALIAYGIDPLEAQLRVQSLTDSEIQLIADKMDDLSAGGGVEIFSLIVLAAIIATVLIFKFTNITDVFP